MLTRFFGESKPINFLMIALYMMVFYLIANAPILFNTTDVSGVLKKIALCLLFILSMVVLNFIAKKNDLNRMNTYTVAIYACFTVLFFNLMQNNNVISANIFIILALRRIISLRTNKDIVRKIFDATLWICMASLFQSWAILFLVVLYFGILVHSNRNWKNFGIPLATTFMVFILTTTYKLLSYNRFFSFSDWYEPSNFDFSQLHQHEILIPTSFILAMLLWVFVAYIKATQRASISQKPSMYLILIALITGIVVAFLSPTKDGSELIFMLTPLAIMTAKYFEREKEVWFKEVLLATLLIMPILIPILF